MLLDTMFHSQGGLLAKWIECQIQMIHSSHYDGPHPLKSSCAASPSIFIASTSLLFAIGPIGISRMGWFPTEY